MTDVDWAAAEGLHRRLKREAEESGYNLNPDEGFVGMLVEGMLVNEDRYGYQSCPCRLASGNKASDLDIICPCDYRDADLTEFGSCYCALYVSGEIARGERKAASIPERRSAMPPEADHKEEMEPVMVQGLPFPVWRCKVCGYLCARPEPPEICPICKAKKERFERFL
jgi:ferredoxin-thioredoxin reductase catalytic chain